MSVAATLAPAVPVGQTQDVIRVMVVDDAVVVRGLVSRWIEAEPGLAVVASLRTGRDAVREVARVNPDVVLLDIDMPDLDGLSALPLLLEKKRDLVVIMASTLSRRNAEVSLKALSLGAADYIPKPSTNREVTTSPTFRAELIEKIRALGKRRRRFGETRVGEPSVAHDIAAKPRPAHAEARSGDIKLRPFALTMPRVLLIGASTGGPQALTSLLGALGSAYDRVPVLITQHMPPTFTTILAEHLARASGRPAREGTDGEPVVPGNIYLAPGGRHMLVNRHNGQPTIALDDGPQINFCKPAVDPLFASAARAFGGAALAVVLTGMGSDGAGGARAIAAAGGSVIAQDEATSVVWGMPGSAAQTGMCSAVLPLADIAPKISALIAGDRS
ncbi:MAG: two-component system, chemotaxis family, protein-glutamate methylesterase/glutaminase [Hyphomicrobiales bacterium]|nr:two-component system, chemotaxis family, protein-glutamate methylesterase/glutaminase [Hyphomicrobiales bacterium]